MVALVCKLARVSKHDEKIEYSEIYEPRDTLIFSGDSLPQASDGENSIGLLYAIL